MNLLMKRVARRLRDGMARRRALSDLAALSDAQLRDVGLDRAALGLPGREIPLLRA